MSKQRFNPDEEKAEGSGIGLFVALGGLAALAYWWSRREDAPEPETDGVFDLETETEEVPEVAEEVEEVEVAPPPAPGRRWQPDPGAGAC